MSISIREARSIIRKAKRRVAEHEAITHINLTAMMDIMTILLVFMIKASTTQTGTLIGDITLPNSKTRMPPPEESVSVTIAKTAILVEGQPVVAVKGGDVDASEKKDGTFGIEITKVKELLSKHYIRVRKIAETRGEEPSRELTIIA